MGGGGGGRDCVSATVENLVRDSTGEVTEYSRGRVHEVGIVT